MIKYMLHDKAYKSKPKKVDAKKFKIVATTIDDLIKSIEAGKSIRPGVIKNNGSTDKDWIQQELIFVDVDDYSIEESIKICNKLNIKPLLMYKTFGYTEAKQKHRLVFRLATPITDADTMWELSNRFIDAFKADSRCCNHSRIYYGTNTKAFNINKDATIDLNTIAKIKEVTRGAQTPHGFIFDKIEAKKHAQSEQCQCLQRSDKTLQQLIRSINILCINCCTKQKNGYNPVTPIDWSLFDTTNFVKFNDTLIATSYSELKDSIKRIPLDKLLGMPLNTSFSCLAHKDKNPSANIFIDENGFYRYKCFSCGLTFDVFDLIIAAYDIKGTKANQLHEAMSLAVEHLGIVLMNTRWHKAQQQMIKDNRALLVKLQTMKEKYPITFKKMQLNQSLLNVLLNVAEYTLDRIPLADVDNHNILFSASYRYLGNQIDRRHETVMKRLDDLMLMGLIHKLSDKELGEYNPKLLRKSKELSSKYDNYKTIQYYTLDTWTESVLINAEDVLSQYKKLGGVKKGASKRQFEAFGVNTRTKAYNDDSEAIRAQKQVMMEWTKRTIKRKKCIIKNDYLKYAKKNKISEEIAASFIIEMCKEFNLHRFIVKKVDIKKYNLPKNTLRKTAFR